MHDVAGHSFGELFQQLAAPPLHAVALALYRAEGTRGAPEPYVYTSPRADTVLHKGDRVFVIGGAAKLSKRMAAAV
jgi:Trk K+ transport system NAD-binding subunit